MKLVFDDSFGPVTPHTGDTYGLPDFTQDVQHLGTFYGRPELEAMLAMMPRWKAQLFHLSRPDRSLDEALAFAHLKNAIG